MTEAILPLPKGAIDVTASLLGKISLPTPALRLFFTANAVMGRAGKTVEQSGYLGKLTEAEAKQLTNRHFSLTRHTDMLLQEIANDRKYGYDSYSEVVRHAVELLVDYCIDHNTFGEHHGYASDAVRRQAIMREDAERARIRLEFSENIRTFDKELVADVHTSDFAAIGKRLRKYLDMVNACESESQKRQFKEAFADSVATRTAVIAFYKWANSKDRVDVGEWDPGWPQLAEQWGDWYRDWNAH